MFCSTVFLALLGLFLTGMFYVLVSKISFTTVIMDHVEQLANIGWFIAVAAPLFTWFGITWILIRLLCG